jgi:TonB family protein
MRRIAQFPYVPTNTGVIREEGTVLTRVTISRQGELLGVVMEKSSGLPSLDAGVMDTIRRASPYPPLPADIPQPVQNLVMTMIAKKPEDRPASAAAVSRACTALRRGDVAAAAAAVPAIATAGALADEGFTQLLGTAGDGTTQLIPATSPLPVATDEEVVEGIRMLAEYAGIFAETAGGVTVAGARKLIASGHIGKDDSAVLCITGHGLKTQEAIIGKCGAPRLIAPNIREFEEKVYAPDLAAAAF